jgi:hypothetical protein
MGSTSDSGSARRRGVRACGARARAIPLPTGRRKVIEGVVPDLEPDAVPQDARIRQAGRGSRRDRCHSRGPALEPGVALSKYVWQFRYPGVPYEPDDDEAARGLALARQLREEILKGPLKGPSGEMD